MNGRSKPRNCRRKAFNLFNSLFLQINDNKFPFVIVIVARIFKVTEESKELALTEISTTTHQIIVIAFFASVSGLMQMENPILIKFSFALLNTNKAFFITIHPTHCGIGIVVDIAIFINERHGIVHIVNNANGSCKVFRNHLFNLIRLDINNSNRPLSTGNHAIKIHHL